MAAKPDATDTGESRRVTRNDPILVSFETADGMRVFDVRELPWRKRNDLGEHTLRTYTEAVNQMMAAGTEDASRMDATLMESLIDYGGILALAFPGITDSTQFDALTFSQMTSLITEALTVNGFDRMVHLIDPKEAPLPTGAPETPTSDPTTDGQKTDSATNSG